MSDVMMLQPHERIHVLRMDVEGAELPIGAQAVMLILQFGLGNVLASQFSDTLVPVL